jgi:hypothetical protein
MEEHHRNRIRKKLLIKVNGQTSVMEDMSKNGMRLVVPVLFKKAEVDILFKWDILELEMKGYVRWIHKEPTVYDQSQYKLGIFITDPPNEYKELVDKLLEN